MASKNKITLGRKSFSLIELMLGVSILLIVIVAALYTFTNCMLLNEAGRNLVTAANDAQYALEQIKSQNFSNIATYISNYSPAKFSNLSNENITFPNPVYASTLDTITVLITWSERNATRSFSITARFAQ